MGAVRQRDAHPAGAADDTLRALEAIDSVRAVCLVGSVARGDARPDSDLDLVVVSDQTVRDLVSRLAVGARDDRVSLICRTPDQVREMALSGSLFLHHVRTEGTVLYDPDRFLAGVFDIADKVPLDTKGEIRRRAAGLRHYRNLARFGGRYGGAGRVGRGAEAREGGAVSERDVPDSEKTIVELVKADYDATHRALAGFVSSGSQLRAVAIAAWGVIYAAAMARHSVTAAVIGVVLLPAFVVADGYYSALYRQTLRRSRDIEALLGNYHNAIGIHRGDERRLIRAVAALEQHAFGVHRGMHPVNQERWWWWPRPVRAWRPSTRCCYSSGS